MDAGAGGYARDEGHEASGSGGTHAEVESLLEARGHEGPGEEVAGLVEVGHTVVVLGVVLVEEVVDLGLIGGFGVLTSDYAKPRGML